MALSLWQQAEKVTRRALATGALQVLSTSSRQFQQDGLPFQVRILENIAKKAAARAAPENPFLEPESALLVADIDPHHRCLLNKYSVMEHHLLLVTRDYVPQQTVLDEADFVALYHCLSQENALAFYNSGEVAGASQHHKHLQLIRLTSQNLGNLPLLPQMQQLHDEVPRSLEVLPFSHAALALPSDLFQPDFTTATDGALQLKHLYDRLRMTLNIEASDNYIEQPYNLLLTRQWMLLIPRTNECMQDISLNSLAFVGSFLVRDEDTMQRLTSTGFNQALQFVTGLTS